MTTDREEMSAPERLMHLKLILEAHEWRQNRVNRTVNRNQQAKHYAERLWQAGVLDVSALSRLLGASRPTIYDWVTRDERKRLRGPKDFGSLQYLKTALETHQSGEGVKWSQIKKDLKASGVPPSLVQFLIGPGKPKSKTTRSTTKTRTKKEKKPAPVAPPEEVRDDADDLRPENRPDDAGHSEEGEGFSIRLYKDPVDHGPAHRPAQPESDHAGHVPGADARDSDADTGSDEGEARSIVNGLVDPGTLTDAEYIEALENGSTWVQPGRQPFSVEPIDFDGDSYLEDLPIPGGDDGLAAGFQEWEQAEES